MNVSDMNTTGFNVPERVLDLGNQQVHKARIDMAERFFGRIDIGGFRLVYDLGEAALKDAVLKVAIDDDGIAQNKQEANPMFEPYYNELLVPVLASHPEGLWLIQKRVIPYYRHVPKPNKGELARFKRRVAPIAKLFRMDLKDMTANHNLGLIDGKLLIFDYGMSQQFVDQYYTRQRARW
ncbi:MAG: hypothetical protein EOO88_36340 [Pedobacter sp.]|nr:MAG: hypothetical protein EOO88_36340 [Pedobacter sp.]